MINTCPHCGQVDAEQKLQAKIEKYCNDNGHFITPLGYVKSAVAAEILGIDSGTLKNYRSYGEVEIPYVKLNKRGHTFYDIKDLIKFLVTKCHQA